MFLQQQQQQQQRQKKSPLSPFCANTAKNKINDF